MRRASVVQTHRPHHTPPVLQLRVLTDCDASVSPPAPLKRRNSSLCRPCLLITSCGAAGHEHKDLRTARVGSIVDWSHRPPCLAAPLLLPVSSKKNQLPSTVHGDVPTNKTVGWQPYIRFKTFAWIIGMRSYIRHTTLSNGLCFAWMRKHILRYRPIRWLCTKRGST